MLPDERPHIMFIEVVPRGDEFTFRAIQVQTGSCRNELKNRLKARKISPRIFENKSEVVTISTKHNILGELRVDIADDCISCDSKRAGAQRAALLDSTVGVKSVMP